MLRPEVLRRRLLKLEEYLGILESLRGTELDEFLSEPKLYATAERFLHLAVEAIDDMSAHIIAERELGDVEASRDLPRIFAEQGYIDEGLAGRWIRMIGFRNIIVHDYLNIDRKIVHDVLENGLDDIRALARVLASFL